MQLAEKSFIQHLAVSQEQLETLLSKSLYDCLNSPEIGQQLERLNISLLKETLPTAGQVLAERLPPFYDWLKNELNVERVPDSPDHATTWVVGFLNERESLTRLVELHRPVPRLALEGSVPRLIATFDGVEDAGVRSEWQKAIAALCLILVVAARDAEKSTEATV